MQQPPIPPSFFWPVLPGAAAVAGPSVFARLVGLLLWIAGAIPSLHAEQVVISEMMYHPPGTKPAWVELENLTATPFDIADWTLTGSELRFQFPAFTVTDPSAAILRPFERLVISEVPAELLRRAYPVPATVRVFGPWSGGLKRSGDRLVLRDKNGVTLCQVRYRDGADWPVAADGAGHSLVLQQTHGTADDWRNWRASAMPLGSPGEAEQVKVAGGETASEAVMTEVHFGPDRSVDWVEVIHRSGPPFAPGELRVATKRDFSDAVAVPGVLGSQERVVLDVRFPAEGSGRERRLYLVTAAGRVMDAREFPVIGPEESWQRFPEHSSEWYRGTAPSRGLANRPARQDQVVINEIMYDPPAGSGVVEFIELLNRGAAPVDLSGWQFTDGVEFRFPVGTVLDAGAHGVIGADAPALRAVHGGLPVLGEFRGKLSNQGERLRLVDALGNLVSEVDFRAGGNWPVAAAGQGSSLELAHPLMAGRLASAWRGSHEAAKSRFQVFQHEGVYEELRPLGAVSDYRELHLHLVEEGHVILRNLRLRHRQTGEDLLDTGARASHDGTGAGGWLIQGNHWASHWDGDELHLVSEGHGDNRANRLEIDVPKLRPGTPCVLSFEARWVSGCARLIAQTWDHSFSFSLRLPVPDHLGTPGRANSRLVDRPSPQLDRLRHSPVVPAPGEAVRVTALVTSAEPPEPITVYHRLDTLAGDAQWRATPMTAGPPAVESSDGASREYAASLMEYGKAGQVVQFYVQAGGPDAAGQCLPVGGRERPALFVVDDRVPPGGLRTSRFVVAARDLASIAEGGGAAHGYRHPKLSNHYLNGTLISNEREVWYNVDVRRSGSAWNRSDALTRGKWKVPADQPFRGRHKWVFDNDTAGDRRYSDRVARHLLYLLGHPTSENEFVRLVVNAGPVELREEVEPVDADFLRRNFPDQEIGNLYRIDDEWWFQDSWEKDSRDADWSFKGTADSGRYRTEWMKRTHEADDDFTGLIRFFQMVSAPDYTEPEIGGLIDADAVLLLAAVSGYIANWDTFTMSRGKNAYFYERAEDGRFQMFHWDSDAAFERDPGEPFYGSHEPFRRWLEQPYNLRVFTRYLGEIVNRHTEGSARMRAFLEAQNLASPDTTCDVARFEAWFKARNAVARERFGSALKVP